MSPGRRPHDFQLVFGVRLDCFRVDLAGVRDSRAIEPCHRFPASRNGQFRDFAADWKRPFTPVGTNLTDDHSRVALSRGKLSVRRKDQLKVRLLRFVKQTPDPLDLRLFPQHATDGSAGIGNEQLVARVHHCHRTVWRGMDRTFHREGFGIQPSDLPIIPGNQPVSPRCRAGHGDLPFRQFVPKHGLVGRVEVDQRQLIATGRDHPESCRFPRGQQPLPRLRGGECSRASLPFRQVEIPVRRRREKLTPGRDRQLVQSFSRSHCHLPGHGFGLQGNQIGDPLGIADDGEPPSMRHCQRRWSLQIGRPRQRSARLASASQLDQFTFTRQSQPLCSSQRARGYQRRVTGSPGFRRRFHPKLADRPVGMHCPISGGRRTYGDHGTDPSAGSGRNLQLCVQHDHPLFRIANEDFTGGKRRDPQHAAFNLDLSNFLRTGDRQLRQPAIRSDQNQGAPGAPGDTRRRSDNLQWLCRLHSRIA